MSLIIGNGICLSYFENEVICPICGQLFDASDKMDKATIPVFNMKCPACKGKITISIPIFGGELECWETNCPPTVKRLRTTTPNRYNGRVPRTEIDSSKYDEDDDEGNEDGDADSPVITTPTGKRK